MFVVQLPGQMETCESPGRLTAWWPSNTFGHMYVEATPALLAEGWGNLSSGFPTSVAIFNLAIPLERACSSYLLNVPRGLSQSHFLWLSP